LIDGESMRKLSWNPSFLEITCIPRLSRSISEKTG
jgi:hypothetical protein